MTYPSQPNPAGGYTGPGAPPPPPEIGTGLKLSQHVGDLVWVRVLKYVPEMTFDFGTRNAVYADIEVLAGRSNVGERFENGLYSNTMLVPQLAQSVGREMFARVAEQPGKNANGAIYLGSPWPGDETYVNAFLARQQQAPPAAPPQPPAQAQPQYQQPAQPAVVPGYAPPAQAQTTYVPAPQYGAPATGNGHEQQPVGMPPLAPPPPY